jgi:uncharacterized cupin superfamily protein
MAKYKIIKVTDVDNRSKHGEMRMMGSALDSEQIALTYRLIPAGAKSPYGHTHSKIDEIIFIFTGTLKIRLDDEVIEVGPKTTVKISPEVKRGYHNEGDEDVEMLVVSPQVDAVGDNGGVPDDTWWP